MQFVPKQDDPSYPPIYSEGLKYRCVGDKVTLLRRNILLFYTQVLIIYACFMETGPTYTVILHKFSVVV